MVGIGVGVGVGVGKTRATLTLTRPASGDLGAVPEAGFCVAHYAGTVTYTAQVLTRTQTRTRTLTLPIPIPNPNPNPNPKPSPNPNRNTAQGFLSKNKDPLSEDLQVLLRASSDPLCATLFAPSAAAEPAGAP